MKTTRRKNMRKFFNYALLIAACLGTTAMLANGNVKATAGTAADARFDWDGAYRDGLYLGKLAADAGQPLHPAIGRWSTEQDRSRFTAGYRHGYGEAGQ
jgi:hypothetical protein